MRIPLKPFVLGLVGLFAWVPAAEAAYLYFSAPSSAVCAGTPFSLRLLLDSPDEAINAGQVDLSFNPTVAQVNTLGTSGSLFKFFAEGPEWDNGIGTVHMIGGLPTPGFQGTGGLIAEVILLVNGSGNSNLQYDPSTDILLDDGYGTSTDVRFGTPNLTVLPGTDPACTAPVTISGNLFIFEGGTSNLSASGGDGTYTWTAPGGMPAGFSGSVFSVSFAQAGSYTVTVTDGHGKTGTATVIVSVPAQTPVPTTPGPTPLPATPGPTPTPCPVCQLYDEHGEVLDLRTCEVDVECANGDPRSFTVFLGADDPTICPIVTRCGEDLDLLGKENPVRTFVRHIIVAPFGVFRASTRGTNLGPFLAGLLFAILTVLILYGIRKLIIYIKTRKERPPRYPGIPR